MKELLDKLSSYNIFNYLFPGILFVIILNKVSSFNLIQEDILLGAFLYYFIGLIISRVGSLFVEPFLRLIKFLKFAEYNDFVKASKDDTKIVLFSEINNMYRTLCSLFLLISISKIYEKYLMEIPFFKDYSNILIIIVLLILFLFSYQKQTNFIRKRIVSNQSDE
jgi:hypothetical protein